MEQNIQDYIKPGRRAHLVGIGGVSMAPLAEVLKGRGVLVTGSDMREGEAVDHLRSLSIPVTIGHLPQSVEGADCVIRTAAVHDDNPEIAAALQAGIPVFERAQAWGAIMTHYQNALCVSGTHGKTTTTSMCAHIFLAAGRDPSVMVGGVLPILGAGHRVGHGDTIIAEACEYCNSFLSFCPTVAVILNVEEDHLDFFRDLADIQHSFRSFAQLVPDRGWVVVNGDNPCLLYTSRTSFSVHFLFSAACELWRHSRDSISPGWTLGRTRRRRPHSISSPFPGKSLLPAYPLVVRQTSGTTCSRPRKKWPGGRCGRPHRPGAYSSRPHSCSTPGG